jgi:uncharacterized membrane protein
MTKERLLAYTDAIIAILVTIMVLEFKAPASSDWAALYEMKDIFIAYILSFILLSTYWTNHHHTFQIVDKVNGTTLIFNNLFLFFISFIPFVTSWIAETHFSSNSVVLYGMLLISAYIAFVFLNVNLIHLHGAGAKITQVVQANKKGRISIALLLIGTTVSVWLPMVGVLVFGIINLIWFVPNKQIERLYDAVV